MYGVSQIEGTLHDEQRVVTKSRMPWQESRRICRSESDITTAQRQSGSSEGYDLEVYDDRMFYSMLLKVRPFQPC
jgi:hypothetical protein